MADALRGLHILVTGATGGVGEALTAELVARGAHVLIHGRDESSLAALGDRLRIPNERRFLADLAALARVSELARAVAAGGALDVLVNNAGVGFGRDRKQREVSADGFELRFAVNFLAPFLLTELAAQFLKSWVGLGPVFWRSAACSPVATTNPLRAVTVRRTFCSSARTLAPAASPASAECAPSRALPKRTAATSRLLHPVSPAVATRAAMCAT